MSEIAPHAMRYAMSVKEPYKQYALPARYNTEGRPENPYVGKLYVTLHPASDFYAHNKPNIIREMHKMGSVTTTRYIGSELEVSFLGRIPKERFEYTQKVRVPSFEKETYPRHYLEKYGIDKGMYRLIRVIHKKYSVHSDQRVITEEYLRDYLSMYHSIRLMLWQFEKANNNNRVIVFLNDDGGLTTEFPIWKRGTVRSEADAESDLAKNLVQTNELELLFYVKGGEIFSQDQLKIFSIPYGLLPENWKKEIDNRRRSSLGGKPLSKSTDLSDLSDLLNNFSFADTSGEDFFDTSHDEKIGISNLFYEVWDTDVLEGEEKEFLPPDDLLEIDVQSGGSTLESVKQESLLLARKQGEIGPRNIEGWILQDVEDEGNCFYHAIIHQMQLINHHFLSEIPKGTLPHNSLRLRVQGAEFSDQEWVDNAGIDAFVKEFTVILAIVSTQNPEVGFVCYYQHNDGHVSINVHGNMDMPDLPIIRLAETGNHFLSVVNHPYLVSGSIHNPWKVTFPIFRQPNSRSSFFSRLNKEFIIEHRHDHNNPQYQQAYDKQFGLILRP